MYDSVPLPFAIGLAIFMSVILLLYFIGDIMSTYNYIKANKADGFIEFYAGKKAIKNYGRGSGYIKYHSYIIKYIVDGREYHQEYLDKNIHGPYERVIVRYKIDRNGEPSIVNRDRMDRFIRIFILFIVTVILILFVLFARWLNSNCYVLRSTPKSTY